jgi:hypothetical protein
MTVFGAALVLLMALRPEGLVTRELLVGLRRRIAGKA